MRIERLLRHLKAGVEDKRHLHAAGALLGHEFRVRVGRLYEIRVALAQLELPEGTYAAAYAAALADVSAAFDAADTTAKNTWWYKPLVDLPDKLVPVLANPSVDDDLWVEYAGQIEDMRMAASAWLDKAPPGEERLVVEAALDTYKNNASIQECLKRGGLG